jgi:tRNA(Ile)-lysidine synthase
MRIAVACSGGADSVALLCTLMQQREKLGLVLSVAHMNHGIRGAESDSDQSFIEALATQFDLPLHFRRVDTPASAAAHREGIEEAARNLRYAWFWEMLASGAADAIVTAHTLDDQSETVLHRLLRGAWTEGLSGIQPVLKPSNPRRLNPNGRILRPFLATTRREIEEWLRAIDQPWREDSSNADTTYTRNRIRHQLLPALAEFNPRVKKQLAQVATLARDEEAYWQAELAKLLPSLLLPGKAVRGGGRATETIYGNQSLSIEIERLRNLHPALQRRVLRAAGAELGFSVNFEDTARLLAICDLGGPEETRHRSNAKLELEKGLRAERTPRELRLLRAETATNIERASAPPEYTFPIPGEIDAPAFGLHLTAIIAKPANSPLPNACLRVPRTGDRVTLRYRRSPLKLKDTLKQARPDYVSHEGQHPLVEWQREIVWVDGLQIESAIAHASGLAFHASRLIEE